MKYEERIEEASALARQGMFVEAERRCREVLRDEPRRADALLLLGLIELQTGRAQQAVGSILSSIRAKPAQPIAFALAGDAWLACGRPAEALQGYDTALQLGLRADSVYFGRGSALLDLGRLEAAVESFDETLRLRPAHPEALFNRGNGLLGLGQFDAAVASYDRAIALQPGYATAHNNRGSALLNLHRVGEALESFDCALGHDPELGDAWSNRGSALIRLGHMREGLADLERALELRPDIPEAHLMRGKVLRALARPLEALESYGTAIRLRPEFGAAHCALGDTLIALGQPYAAAESFAAALRSDPQLDFVAGALIHAQGCCADWSERVAGPGREQVERLVLEGRRTDSPFSFLAVSDSAAAQWQCARTFLAARCRVAKPLYEGRRYSHERIRVAYLSADFREHAVSYLMAGVWEKHDPGMFETFGVSFRPPEVSPMGQRARAAFSRFIDVSSMSDDAVAQLLFDLEIDIAVDLSGFTEGMRPDILSRRPARIQVNYLGFPGTMGAEFIDYLIADRFVISPETRGFFSEHLVQLPECFQANDERRQASGRSWTRSELGLPERAFVFCCLNNTFKINPVIFDVWMRILDRVPDAVLWLLDPGEPGRANLRREAEQRGVAPGRLVFAPRWPYDEHLARQTLADLFLDTLPFNGGATVSDALHSGLPVLSCAGEAFAARMAGSMLHTLGVPELVTATLADYESLAITLSLAPERLKALRERLAQARFTSGLFDTDRFRRHLEAAYLQMLEFQERGDPPRDFAVPFIER